MMTATRGTFLPATVAQDLRFADLAAALKAGWADYRACPQYGLFFGAFYVAGGLLLTWTLMGDGSLVWLVPAAGFPLLAPFSAVGLYEASRRREAGLPVTWRSVLGAVRGRGDEQILGVGVVVFVIFMFWVILAHGIFYIFLAQAGMTTESLAFLSTPAGMAMLVVGGVVGGLLALAMFAVTVISLPLLVDRDVDTISAMAVSVVTLRDNTRVLLGWGAFIAAALFAAMVPAFLGLLVVLPVLAHATWHLYRRAVTPIPAV